MKKYYQMTLDEKVSDTIEKYKCDCKYADSWGCSDCQNTGFCFDTQEIALIEDLYEAVKNKRCDDKIILLFGILIGYIFAMILFKVAFL